MATWALRYGNDELPLTGRAPFDLVSINGIGTPPIRRLTARGPFQDGDSDLGFRLDARTFNLVLFFNAADRATADTYRAQLYDYIKPMGGALQLRCTRDDGEIRQMDCYPVGVIDMPVSDTDRMFASQKIAVQLRAADPVWYDPQLKYWGAVGGGATGASGFAVPVTVPWVQANNTFISTQLPITYSGSWASYPIVEITGPGTGITLENTTTGHVLDFPLLALAGGETVTIDLRYGYKTVTDGTGANVIDELSDDSDLAEWHLAAAPEASGGTNLLQFTVDASATSATSVRLSYYHRYIGL